MFFLKLISLKGKENSCLEKLKKNIFKTRSHVFTCDFYFHHLKARFRFLQAANQNEYTCQYIPIGNSY